MKKRHCAGENRPIAMTVIRSIRTDPSAQKPFAEAGSRIFERECGCFFVRQNMCAALDKLSAICYDA